MIKIILLERNADNYEYAFILKKEAMGPHIISKWGWDEEYQRGIHQEKWKEKTFYNIFLDDESIGIVAIDEHKDHIRFGEFYIKSRYQGNGYGSEVLEMVLKQAKEKVLPVRLEYLKWNPVGSLYKRYGFRVTHESEIHYYLEKEPQQKV